MFQIDYQNIDRHIIYSHQTNTNPKVDFHLHEGYELYFLISGDVKYFVEQKIYPIEYGDLMFTNNHEIHKPAFQSNKIYERIVLEFNPQIIQFFNSPGLNLLNCFVNRPNGEQNKLPLNPHQLKDVLELFNKIEHLAADKTHAGYEILKLNYLIELLVYINRIFLNIAPENVFSDVPEKLIPILDYINNNLDCDLNLDILEKKFYIDRFYLSKLFKKSIGSNLHSYIIYKRISKAKELLSHGMSVTDTCTKCGFNDYSNFLKMFKRTVGISPGKYKQHSNSRPRFN